jgi:hypothetical protein
MIHGSSLWSWSLSVDRFKKRLHFIFSYTAPLQNLVEKILRYFLYILVKSHTLLNLLLEQIERLKISSNLFKESFDCMILLLVKNNLVELLALGRDDVLLLVYLLVKSYNFFEVWLQLMLILQ